MGGSGKNPSFPNACFHFHEGFLDGDNVSFVDRPFPLDEADVHLDRIKGYGYNVIRFLIT